MKRKSIEEIFAEPKNLSMSIRKVGNMNPTANMPRPQEVKDKISDSLRKYHQNIKPVQDNNND